MTKRVVVIASGETERRAIPILVGHLRGRGVAVEDVRVPPSNRPLTVEVAEKIIKSVWYENIDAPPDKFVLLFDLDGGVPDEVLGPIKRELAGRLGVGITTKLQYAYAQRHLEAWYFADVANLRNYLGRSPGSVDTSQPDEIDNPKRRLKELVNQLYTARISEEIARELDAGTIEMRSPSFRGFLEAVMNGDFPAK